VETKRKKGKKANNTHKREDAGVKKENKNSVTVLLGLTQHCHIIGNQ